MSQYHLVLTHSALAPPDQQPSEHELLLSQDFPATPTSPIPDLSSVYLLPNIVASPPQTTPPRPLSMEMANSSSSSSSPFHRNRSSFNTFFGRGDALAPADPAAAAASGAAFAAAVAAAAEESRPLQWSSHYGSKQGKIETLKYTLSHERGSEVSERANE